MNVEQESALFAVESVESVENVEVVKAVEAVGGAESVDDAAAGADPELEAILAWFLALPHHETRFAQVFRQSIDEVLDGQRTQRFDLSVKTGEGRVEKTEKTYLGTKVEIVARAAFELGYGKPMDYLVEGVNVDAKWTSDKTWTIPQEAMGHLCLLMRADDAKRFFQVGLLRISKDVLTSGKNGDGKLSVSAAGKERIRWIVEQGTLPQNFLLRLKQEHPEKVAAVFHASDGHRGPGNGGQLRINELFRQVAGELVDRNTALTVATQQDGPKRVRDARKHLRPEGYVILGHYKPEPQIAADLGLPVPAKGSWVSAKLAVAGDGDDRPATEIDGVRYVLWREGDAPVEAPTLG
ncbi:NaeI family type II restriction endonuclease [Streptomyces sp. NPDC097619]|uniref:NaeI family type II restriction endonuclease n=1 Tax=Streptomyces sp. NPDC097619 TaxID=3157228 RepID=UPI0033265623